MNSDSKNLKSLLHQLNASVTSVDSSLGNYKILIIALLAVWHLATLSISPMPWFDEVFFVNISENVYSRGNFLLDILPQYYSGEFLMYGPVYFVTQAFIIHLFGLDIWTFRILGLTCCLLICYLLRHRLSIITLSLMMTAPVFIANSHSGRMDMLALFFCILAYLPFLKDSSKNISFRTIIYISILFSLAALTTPRVVFLFPGVYVYLLTHWYSSTDKWSLGYILKLLCPPIFVVLSEIAWSLFSTGSVFGVLQEFKSNSTVTAHVGISLFRGHLSDLLTILFLLLCVYNLFKHKKLPLKRVMVLTNLLFFSLFVKEVGPYAAMIIPFLAIGISPSSLTGYDKNGILLTFKYFILIVFLGVFTFKSLVLFDSRDSRNSSMAEGFISKHVDGEKTVVANFKYFYALRKNGNKFINYKYTKLNDIQTVKTLLKERPTYLLIGEEDKAHKIAMLMIEEGYSEIAMLRTKDSVLADWLPKFIANRVRYTVGYEGRLYKKKS